jgi:hypothetical protein
VAAGYTGFRAATQIDPLWNAYLLDVVIALGPSIEAARIPTEIRWFSLTDLPLIQIQTRFLIEALAGENFSKSQS